MINDLSRYKYKYKTDKVAVILTDECCNKLEYQQRKKKKDLQH